MGRIPHESSEFAGHYSAIGYYSRNYAKCINKTFSSLESSVKQYEYFKVAYQLIISVARYPSKTPARVPQGISALVNSY